MRRVDVVALVFGLLLTAVASGSLWVALTGSVSWSNVSLVAPLALVAAGVLGLALSRNRS